MKNFHRIDLPVAVTGTLVLSGLLGLAVVEGLSATGHPVLGSVLVKALAIALVALPIGWFAARQMLKPIDGMANTLETLEARTSADLSAQASRGDAIGRIARDLGRIADETGGRRLAERTALFKSSAFDNGREAMMVVDANRDIVMINQGTRDLFADNLDAFRTIWSDLDPERLIGRSIDNFHAHPDVQRRLLSDPSRLPYETDISIGALRFNMNVTAVMDHDGAHVGNVLEWRNVTQERMNASILGAIEISQAVIEFDLDGTITFANQNFLSAVGYDSAEIMGGNHSLFVDDEHAESAAYANFWRRLRTGETIIGKVRRIGKDGRSIWLEAAYNAVKDTNGNPYKVVKIAADITKSEETRQKHEAERAEKIAAQALVVDALETALRALSAGDLDVGITQPFSEEYESLRDDFNGTITALQDAERIRREQEADLARKAASQQHVVDRLATCLRELADGNLTTHIDDVFDPEYEALRNDFNATVGTLGSTLDQITGASHAIETGSAELAAATLNLATRTEAQSASLEQTAAALEELTTTVTHTSQSAEDAKNVVNTVCQQAEKSDQVIGKAIHAMDAIKDSSEKISKITGVIEEIAFQTNLLALNAGVEAARAGEAGRGFAVVASEVRALAQRSSDAAKDINDLISTSSDQVNKGVRMVDETGEALGTIAREFSKVANLVVGIAHSAKEQAIGVAEINSAVNKMDSVTQQNAAMVEEATAACHTLSSEAHQMNVLMDHFQIGTDLRTGLVSQGEASDPSARVAANTAPPPARIPGPVAGPGSTPAGVTDLVPHVHQQQSRIRQFAAGRHATRASQDTETTPDVQTPHAAPTPQVARSAQAAVAAISDDWSEF